MARTNAMVKIGPKMPLPPAREGHIKYPWATMKVGDNFFVKAADDDVRLMQQKLSTLACMFSRRHGMKFATRRVEGGVRVWRIK